MYSSIQRLRLSKTDRILVMHAPECFSEYEQYFTAGIDREIRTRAYPSVFYFTDDLKQADQEISQVLRALAYDGLFWFCFPRSPLSDSQSRITREDVVEFLAPHDLQAVSQRTIDEYWTALRMRPKELVHHRR